MSTVLLLIWGGKQFMINNEKDLLLANYLAHMLHNATKYMIDKSSFDHVENGSFQLHCMATSFLVAGCISFS